MDVDYRKNVIDFEKTMICEISMTLEFAISQYQKLQSLKAPAEMLEKLALRIKKYEDQIHKLEQAIASR
jgi:hypothetical protein